MSLIISIFRDVTSEFSNIEMRYSCLYFKDKNRKFLENDFFLKISIYKDKVKNIVLLEMF